MIFLINFLFNLWIQDSLENRLLSQYMSDSTRLIESYYIEYKGAKDFVHEIEVKNIEDLMVERGKGAEKVVIHKVIKDSVFRSFLKETGGLIPEIDIPIPIPRVLGIGEGANIKISGSQDITFGVRQDLYRDPSLQSQQTSNLPQFEMNQKLRVNTTGTIGRKIKVILDHDSEREVQYKNTVKLQYQGDEDEIIRLIEAGNTQFNIPGVAGSGGKGLFGIKGVAQFGPITMEGILSREQGQAKKVTISPTFAKQDTIYDFEFEKGKFFRIPLPQGDSIIKLWVFYDDGNPIDTTGKRRTYLFLNPLNPDSLIPQTSFFRILSEGIEWNWLTGTRNVIQLLPNGTEFQGMIRSESNEQLAVAYITKSGLKVGSFGDTTNPDTLLLIKASQLKSYQDPTWWNELRNIYYLGQNARSVKIYRITTSEQLSPFDKNNRNILQVLGLDNDNNGEIDGIIKINGRDFSPLQGVYLVFPHEMPFAHDSLSPRNTSIYMYSDSTSYQNAKYVIVFEAERRKDKIQLDYGIIEGSEEVTFGGIQWERGRDYQIDYETGELTILNSRYFTDVTQNLEIKYEVGTLLQMKQRSFLGLKANYDMGKILTMENLFVMRMESSIDKRPRLGEEPVRMGQYTMNLKSLFTPHFLTEFVDKLPLVKTDKESEIQFNLTYNQSFPNPNIYGTAYLDDMEATEQSFELYISYRSWQRGSPPPGYSLQKLCRKLIWSTRSDIVDKKDINPNIKGEEANDPVNAMQVIFRPMNGEPDEWASLHALISPEGFDFSSYDYIEVIIKGDRGYLGIDLASSMNENSFWRDRNGNLKGDPERIETEDGIPNPDDGTSSRDGKLQWWEDVGMDRVRGDDGKGVAGDDGNDDWKNDAEHVNGTEGNGFLDGEDLDGDGRINDPDNLFEHIIDLQNDQPVYVSPSGFKIYRVYLKDFTPVGNHPDWKKIKFARIWFSNITDEDTLIIVSIKIVGNRYLKDGIFIAGKSKIPVDTLTEKFAVTTYNNKDHIFYDPPPMKLYRDPQTGQEEREASLVLKFENLKPTHFARATKRNYRPENIISDYRKLKLWVKGYNLNVSVLKYLIVRFYSGTDTLNYYEFRCSVPKGNWTSIEIDPLKFLETKKKRPDNYRDKLFQNPDEPSYFVKGEPNLRNITKYSFGILNLTGEDLTGEVWIDEFRVSEPLRESAYRINTFLRTDFADLLSLNLRYENFLADFRDLNYQPGTGTVSTSTHQLYDLSTTLNLNKFLPAEGFNIPFVFGYKRTFEFPKYMPASDVILKSSESKEQKTDRMEKSFSLNFSKSGSKNTFLKYTLDRLTFGILRSEDYRKDPLNLDTLKSFNAQTSYSLPVNLQGFRILGQEVNLLPSNIGGSLKYAFSRHKRYTFQDSIYLRDTNLKNLIGNSSYSLSFRPLRSVNFDFSSSQNYDLRRKEVKGNWWGEMNTYSQNSSFAYRPVLPFLFKNFLNSFSFNYNGNFNAYRNTDISDTVRFIPWNNVSSNNSYTFQGVVDAAGLINKMIFWAKPEAKEGFKILKNLNPFNLSYTKSFQSNYYYLDKLPNYNYRFGFTHKIPFDSTSPYASGNTIIKTENQNVSTGFDFDIFDFQTKYNRNDRISTPFLSPPTRNITIEFPSFDFTATTLQLKFPLVKKYLSSLSFQTGYVRREEKGISVNSKSISNSNNFSPLFNFQGRFRNGVGFNLSYNYTKSKGQTKTSTATSETSGETKTTAGSIDFSYSNPKGIKLPFMRGSILKLKSQLNVNLRFSLTENKRKTGYVPYHTQTQNFSIDLNYALTKDITGSGSIQYLKTIDKMTKVQTGNLSLFFGVSFKF